MSPSHSVILEVNIWETHRVQNWEPIVGSH